MAKVHSSEEILPEKFTSLSRVHERYRQTDKQTNVQTPGQMWLYYLLAETISKKIVQWLFSSPQYIWDWTVATRKLGGDKTKLSYCLVANCVHTGDTDNTREDSFVLSMSAVWTSYNTACLLEHKVLANVRVSLSQVSATYCCRWQSTDQHREISL